MKSLRLFFAFFWLFCALGIFATPLESAISCSLPAPSWISAPTITSSSISIVWEPVEGALWYKVSRYDVTNAVQLPDVYVSQSRYTTESLNPGTTITFDVQATSCDWSEAYGQAVTSDFTTSIIIVDVVLFTAPNSPSGNIAIGSGNSNEISLHLSDANNSTMDVEVTRAKVKFTDSQSVLHFAELLLWSQCSDSLKSAVRVMYWNTSTWPSTISYVENHLGGNPNNPITSITFRISGAPFFTLYHPFFSNGENGGPHNLDIKIRNDRHELIFLDLANSEEDNPCFIPPQPMGGNTPSKDDSLNHPTLSSDRSTNSEQSELSMLISPNPFLDGFNMNFTLEKESPVNILMYDPMGRLVRNINFNTLTPGQHSIFIAADNLPTTIYSVAIQSNAGRAVSTVLKQN